eukprot:snap_masked-scaffold_2-processed-gene-16.4-mRNA-1 protein AED:1.00 eAED:1.00 QI:0/-1/0/0/-1/1/1/0/762
MSKKVKKLEDILYEKSNSTAYSDTANSSRVSFLTVGQESVFSNPFNGEYDLEDDVFEEENESEANHPFRKNIKQMDDFDKLGQFTDPVGWFVNQQYVLYDDTLKVLRHIYNSTRQDELDDANDEISEMLNAVITEKVYEKPSFDFKVDFFSDELQLLEVRNAIFPQPIGDMSHAYISSTEFRSHINTIKDYVKEKTKQFLDIGCPDIYEVLQSRIEAKEKELTKAQKEIMKEKQEKAGKKLDSLKTRIKTLQSKNRGLRFKTVRNQFRTMSFMSQKSSNSKNGEDDIDARSEIGSPSSKGLLQSLKKDLRIYEVELLGEGLLSEKYNLSGGTVKFLNSRSLFINEISGVFDVACISTKSKKEKIKIFSPDVKIDISFHGTKIMGTKIKRFDISGEMRVGLLYKQQKGKFVLEKSKFDMNLKKRIHVHGKKSAFFSIVQAFVVNRIIPKKLKNYMRTFFLSKVNSLKFKSESTATVNLSMAAEICTDLWKADLSHPTKVAFKARQALRVSHEEALLLQMLFLNLPKDEGVLPVMTLSNLLLWSKRFQDLSYDELDPYFYLVAFENERIKMFLFRVWDRLKHLAKKKMWLDFSIKEYDCKLLKSDAIFAAEGVETGSFSSSVLYSNMFPFDRNLLFFAQNYKKPFFNNAEKIRKYYASYDTQKSVKLEAFNKHRLQVSLSLMDSCDLLGHFFHGELIDRYKFSTFNKFVVNMHRVPVDFKADTDLEDNESSVTFRLTDGNVSAGNGIIEFLGEQDFKSFLKHLI